MIESINRKQMRISKKPEHQLKHAKCPNCHCANYDTKSESNCIFDIETAMKCLYNEENQYEKA